MSYIEESLSKDEEVIDIFEIHWIKNVLILILFILGFLTYGITFLMAIYYHLVFKCTEYGLTNKRVIKKIGIISRKTSEMQLLSIEKIEVDQGILGRIFGWGTVKISGKGIGEVNLELVLNPIQVKVLIESSK